MDKLFKPEGVCSKYIKINIDEKDNKEESILKEVSFFGGCPGNAIGLAKAVEGRTVKEVHDLLKGVKCGSKESSCPDQLSRALEEYLNN